MSAGNTTTVLSHGLLGAGSDVEVFVDVPAVVRVRRFARRDYVRKVPCYVPAIVVNVTTQVVVSHPRVVR